MDDTTTDDDWPWITYDGELAVARSDVDGGWFVVRAADGSDALTRGPGLSSVEGTAADMRGLAAAIVRRGTFFARRCAVIVDATGASLWSPRNSRRQVQVSVARADALAALITATLGGAS